MGVDGGVLLDRVAEVRGRAPEALMGALDEIDDDRDGQVADVRSRLQKGLDAHLSAR